MLIRDYIITPSKGGPFSPEGQARYKAFNATACNAWEKDYNGSPTGIYRREATKLWREAFEHIGAIQKKDV